jgi:hypothetical protein
VITELFPSLFCCSAVLLFLLHAAKPAAEHRFTDLLRVAQTRGQHPVGRTALAHAAALDALLGDRHHALPAAVTFARRCGTILTASGIEAKALAVSSVKVGRILEFKRHTFAPACARNPADLWAGAYARRVVVSVDAWRAADSCSSATRSYPSMADGSIG